MQMDIKDSVNLREKTLTTCQQFANVLSFQCFRPYAVFDGRQF